MRAGLARVFVWNIFCLLTHNIFKEKKMKKIIIYSMLSVVALALVGCGGNGSDAAIKDLNSQLDRAQSAIEVVSKQDLSGLVRSDYSSTYQPKPIYTSTINLLNLQNKVSNDVTAQNQLSGQLQGKIADIKAMLKNNKTKYSTNQVKTIKALTEQLSGTATKLKNSKDDVKSGLELISRHQNVNHMSIDGLGSGYNSVSNALELRKAYLFNLANTLSQVEGILNDQQLGMQDYSNSQTQSGGNGGTNSNVSTQEEQRKNINIPEPVSNSGQDSQDGGQDGQRSQNGQSDGQNNGQSNKNIDTMPQFYPYAHRIAPYGYNGYGYNGYGGGYGGGYGYNGFYGNNFGYGGYGYGPYGYRGGLNPGRNTDTYRPNYINIDTYRWSKRGTIPNGEYQVQVISTQPFEVIEDEELEQDELGKENEEQNGLQQEQKAEFESLDIREKSSAQKLVDQNKEIMKTK